MIFTRLDLHDWEEIVEKDVVDDHYAWRYKRCNFVWGAHLRKTEKPRPGLKIPVYIQGKPKYMKCGDYVSHEIHRS